MMGCFSYKLSKSHLCHICHVGATGLLTHIFLFRTFFNEARERTKESWDVLCLVCENWGWYQTRAEHINMLKNLNWKVLQEEELFPRPQSGLLSNTQKWIVWGDTHMLTNRETLLGRDGPMESSREPKRTTLPRGSRSWVSRQEG